MGHQAPMSGPITESSTLAWGVQEVPPGRVLQASPVKRIQNIRRQDQWGRCGKPRT